MTKRIVEKSHGHWKLTGQSRELLLECRAEEDTRYALKGIGVTEGALASTDGRRLVEIECSHKIPPGTYYVSEDGYLLETAELAFPKYRDIIPQNTRRIVKVKDVENGWAVIGLILGELCHSGCIVNLSLYQRPIEILSGIIKGTIEVYVDKGKPAECPFLIKTEAPFGDVTYVQMPINVKNEA